jgi:N-acetylmuramoyl-L-alanine amidase
MNKKLNLAIAIGLTLALMTSFALNAGATDHDSGEYKAYQYEASASSRSSLPSGAYGISVNVNGRSVLSGRAFVKDGVTYVPMFAFADWLGVFSYSYNTKTATAYVNGTNLEISAQAGKLYISANGRCFYTDAPVISHNGTVYVPIRPMVKALNSHISWNSSAEKYYVGSGDTRRLRSGDSFYREDEVDWLARIISAESRGEPMKGKIAVGNVVLNRVRSSAYPNTIYGVIFDKRYGIQFSPVANGTIYNTPTAESIIAAKICLEGYTLSNEILYFLNPSVVSSSWITKTRPYAFKVGNHAFYK